MLPSQIIWQVQPLKLNCRYAVQQIVMLGFALSSSYHKVENLH